jgi:hypothetical protein
MSVKRKRKEIESSSEDEVQQTPKRNPDDLNLNHENLNLKHMQRVLNGEDLESISQGLFLLYNKIFSFDFK